LVHQHALPNGIGATIGHIGTKPYGVGALQVVPNCTYCEMTVCFCGSLLALTLSTTGRCTVVMANAAVTMNFIMVSLQVLRGGAAVRFDDADLQSTRRASVQNIDFPHVFPTRALV
jgi:hypothetical protein